MNTKYGKNFILMVVGQIISLFGNAILRFALPLYLLRKTNSPALFGLVTACSFLPMVFLSFIGGVLADRVNKRNIMVTLDFLTAFIVFMFFIFIGKLSLVPLMIVVLMLLYGISGAYQPTVQASIPALVSSEHILSAGAIVNQVASLSGLLGPIFGGMLFGAFGITPILFISILCFIASAVMEIFIKIPFEVKNDNSGMLSIIKNDLKDCAIYMRKEKPILIKIILLIAIFNLVLSAMITVGIPIIVVQVLHMSDELLGLSQGMLALGGLCGGILTSIFSKKLKFSNSHILLFVCSLSVGVMSIPLLLGMGNMISYVVVTVFLFLVMAPATMFTIQMFATIQTEAPPELIGKIIALLMSISMCTQPIGQAIYGLIFDKLQNNTGIILLCVAMLSSIISFIAKKDFKELVK